MTIPNFKSFKFQHQKTSAFGINQLELHRNNAAIAVARQAFIAPTAVEFIIATATTGDNTIIAIAIS